jgi:hypothetical protein
MKTIFTVSILLFSALLTGCAGTGAQVKQAYSVGQQDKFRLALTMPADTNKEAESILRDRIVTQLADNNLLPPINATNFRTLEVTVTNYRMRNGAVRFLAGILAGPDNILSTVTVKDAAGRVLGQYEVESKNPTAWGTSRGMIEAHADKIVRLLQGSKD